MDKLPTEVLHYIFPYLHLLQKQECMLVCRRWSNILRSTCLLTTVHINRKINFDRLAQILDNNPSYRYQIRNLFFHASFTLNIQQVLSYFPNLRSIHTEHSDIILKPAIDKNSSLYTNLKAWRNQIETIESNYRFRYNKSILFSGAYSSVKTVVINGYSFPIRGAKLLANAPNINNLKIIRVEISLKGLALLHNSLKALETLELENAELKADNEPTDIIPENLTSMRALLISFNYSVDDTVIKWLQYITRNYPLLLHFKFVFPWTHLISSQQGENITINGMIPLIQKLGHQLKHLDISCSDGAKPLLRTLSVLEHDIQILRIHTLISVFRCSFTSLVELGSLIHELSITLNSISRLDDYNLKDFKMLKKLQIGHMNHQTGCTTIHLVKLLNSCPNSLESLEIYDFDIVCDSMDSCSVSLRELIIHSNIIPETVYQFISSSFPNLKYFTIDQRSGTNNGTIMLKDKDFHYLEISMVCNTIILINTLHDNTAHYYHLGAYKHSGFYNDKVNSCQLYGLIKRTTLKQTRIWKNVIELTCNSINTLIINKELAF